METIINVDVCNSTLLEPVLRDLRPQIQALGEAALASNGRQLWLTQGDCMITAFSQPDLAVSASVHFLMRLAELNADKRLADSPLFVRIGMELSEQPTIWDIPEPQRGEHVSHALNAASKLQKKCPVGKIAISPRVYEALGPFQKLFRPTLGDGHFVLQSRPLSPQEELLTTGLSPKQREALPAMCFLSWGRIRPDRTLKDLRRVLDAELVIVLGDTTSQTRGVLQSAATSDAIGLMEALAVLQHTDLKAGIDEWHDTADLVATRNAIIVGSGATNLYALVLNDIFEPLHFVKTAGRTTDQIVAGSRSPKLFGRHGIPPADSGLIILSRSVFHPDKSIVWLGGNTGMGTQAVATFLKDLLKGQVSIDDRAVGLVVAASVGEGVNVDLSEYFRRWRISAYKILHWVDADGRGFDVKH